MSQLCAWSRLSWCVNQSVIRCPNFVQWDFYSFCHLSAAAGWGAVVVCECRLHLAAAETQIGAQTPQQTSTKMRLLQRGARRAPQRYIRHTQWRCADCDRVYNFQPHKKWGAESLQQSHSLTSSTHSLHLLLYSAMPSKSHPHSSFCWTVNGPKITVPSCVRVAPRNLLRCFVISKKRHTAKQESLQNI